LKTKASVPTNKRVSKTEAAGLQPSPKLKLKEHKFCININGFTLFTLQPKLGTDIRIIKKIK
jgi:hypothetical protein